MTNPYYCCRADFGEHEPTCKHYKAQPSPDAKEGKAEAPAAQAESEPQRLCNFVMNDFGFMPDLCGLPFGHEGPHEYKTPQWILDLQAKWNEAYEREVLARADNFMRYAPDKSITNKALERSRPSPSPEQGPCSCCGDGDTAMQHHSHESVSTLEEQIERMTDIISGYAINSIDADWLLLLVAKERGL